MEKALVIPTLRRLGFVTIMALSMAIVSTAPALAEPSSSSATAACGADQSESGEVWAAPPERGRPGEPY
jgi:hypothetical protein